MSTLLDLKTFGAITLTAALGTAQWALSRTVAEADTRLAVVSSRAESCHDKVIAIQLDLRDSVKRKDLDGIKEDLAKIRTSLAEMVAADQARRRVGGR